VAAVVAAVVVVAGALTAVALTDEG